MGFSPVQESVLFSILKSQSLQSFWQTQRYFELRLSSTLGMSREQASQLSSTKSYQVLRKASVSQMPQFEQPAEVRFENFKNIFSSLRDSILPTFNPKRDRPLGGIELFTKIQAQQSGLQSSNAISRNGLNSHAERRFYRSAQSSQGTSSRQVSCEALEKVQKKTIQDQEVFKEQKISIVSPKRLRTGQSSVQKSKKSVDQGIRIYTQTNSLVQILAKKRPVSHAESKFSRLQTPSQQNVKFSRSKKQSMDLPYQAPRFPSGVDSVQGNEQSRRHSTITSDRLEMNEQQFFAKKAILQQLEYEQPLSRQLGSRYFEFILRDRFKEEGKKSAFIYQLKGNENLKTKFINTIYKQRPDIAGKKSLALKGRKLPSEQPT